MLLYLLFSYSSFLNLFFRTLTGNKCFEKKRKVLYGVIDLGAGVKRRNEKCWVVKKGGMIEGVIWDLTTKSSQAWKKVKTIHFEYCRKKERIGNVYKLDIE